jgi:hypothetical protein
MNRSLLVVLSLVAVSCGGSETPAPSEQTAPPAGSGGTTTGSGAENSFDQMAKGMEQFAQGLQQMAESGGGSATPVAFESLQALLPEVSGWTRSNARGEQMSAPVAFSRAEAHYQNGDAEIELEITDTALSQLLIAPFSMFLASGFEERSSEGFKRATTIGSSPGFEEWTHGSQSGEVMTFVGKRFVVHGKGNGVASLDPIKQVVQAVDMEKLAALR